MEQEEKLAWVGLSMVKGIGPARFRALLKHFGSAVAAWSAPASTLEALLPPKVAHAFLQLRSQTNLAALWENWRKRGIAVLTWEDEAYPRRLKMLDHAPPVLYMRGEIMPEDDWAVAVVGTRKITAYGRKVASDVAKLLAESGVTVVSGLARGVDGVAHRTAIQAGGRTIAVLGSGVDVIYPPEHRKLAAEIITNGALLSEYPPGTRPDAANFPPRNRIISGISAAVVIVEAGEKSGALITASFAAEQGRDVFAVPGNIYAAQSRGTNWLIQQGARPLTSPTNVLEALDAALLPQKQEARRTLPANQTEKLLLAALGDKPMHVDDLSAAVGLPVSETTAALTLMELKGMVQSLGGMRYAAVSEPSADYTVSKQ